MEIQDEMKHLEKSGTDPRNAADDNSAAAGSNEPVSTSRRRFTRAGLSGSVLMTLASRPALASHCSVSGIQSGNLSRPQGGVVCAGLSPGYWKTHPEEWACGYSPGSCTESGGGTCQEWDDTGNSLESMLSGTTISVTSDLTMMQTMWADLNTDFFEDNPTAGNLAFHLVAAFLNACRFGGGSHPGGQYGYDLPALRTFIDASLAVDGSGSTLKSQLISLYHRGGE
jgi:hypothetical protein